jgi:hypothetical protein
MIRIRKLSIRLTLPDGWPRATILCMLLYVPPLPANAAAELHEYPVRPAREYRAKQTKEGLSVALEPVVNKKALKTCFGIDLVSRGFMWGFRGKVIAISKLSRSRFRN